MADSTVLRQRLATRYDRAAARYRDVLVEELHRSAAPHRKTGELDHSIHGIVLPSGLLRYRIVLSADAPQASLLNKGTRPHVIVPVNRRALAFTAGGRRVVVRRVNHPGTRPTHWWDRVMDQHHVLLVDVLAGL